MHAYEQHLQEDRRLCILRLLEDTTGTLNDSVIRSLLEKLGHARLSRDTVRADITFLVEGGLVTTEWVGTVQVVTLTRRGLEVAQGRVVADGIKRPSIAG